MTVQNTVEECKPEEKHHHTHHLVTIIVDNKPIQIHRGHETVVEIKEAGHVPLAYDLNEVINGKLVLLPDNGLVVIKGGEVFLSHVKGGSSA